MTSWRLMVVAWQGRELKQRAHAEGARAAEAISRVKCVPPLLSALMVYYTSVSICGGQGTSSA